MPQRFERERGSLEHICGKALLRVGEPVRRHIYPEVQMCLVCSRISKRSGPGEDGENMLAEVGEERRCCGKVRTSLRM